MDVRHLRYFVAVAEEQHFTRAAKRLTIAQATLSAGIQRLETELNVQLLQRSTRTVTLTPAGRFYLERAHLILRDIDDASDNARRVAAGSVGRLVVGCVESVTYALLPTLSRALASQLPAVDFAYRGEMLASDQAVALRDGAIDIAVLRPPVDDFGLTVIPVRRDRLLVALPRGHHLASAPRVRWKQLAGSDLIVHSADRRSVIFDVVTGLMHDSGIEPDISHEVGEISTLITLVAGGLGIAVVPEPATTLKVDGVVYRPLVAPAATVDLAIAHQNDRREAYLTRAVETIRRIV
ncbi:LysR family transcriptional regulator [Flexivirga endophytica]|uniref:LysR family transcriptional regulator n=1 Tax=Flexivirga endophytica TaxID=1849103 RepID=A0A916WPW7_9MICO|nr:LysR family transcriptional regulator [Flexivirga endophytica]GGB21420.1 LysR family transcriptional regulator [Flexivirga endophytica]GHB59083.1 LysR family transcriptional regulator [Flexivirga endophytica]